MPAFALRLRLSEALLAVSFFLIGFFSVWSDAPADRYQRTEAPARTR